jgi:uncharacterized protein
MQSNPYDLRIQFDQRVPMRDGITLSADIYFSVTNSQQGKHPAILLRTPYLKTDINLDMAKYFVKSGYFVVAMDVRGRGDSDGEFVPYFNEGKDGYDAIEWCAAQPWCDGNVGTWGASYSGRCQWLAALEQPPHLHAMVVMVPPSDPFVETPTGTPSPMHLCWLHLVSGRVPQSIDPIDWFRVYEHLPLLTMDESVGHPIPIWRKELEHTQLDDYWLPLCYQTHFDHLTVPTFHISGWYDDEQVGTPLNYVGMTTQAPTPEARASQRLLMGPWPHSVNRFTSPGSTKFGDVDFGPQALIDLYGEQVRWYDRWLRQREQPPEAPVRLFVMGTNEWRDEQEWPLARTQWTAFYLHSGGHANSRTGDGWLSVETTPAQETFSYDAYDYDPALPFPFITDATSTQIGGPDDYAILQQREDVLVYVTSPLSEDVEVTGPIQLDLYAASSAPDTDFMAMLLDVWPDGFCQRLCDGMVRARFRKGMTHPSLIEPGQVYHYAIDCWNTSQVFKVGHRICLQLSSSAFPKYDRNQNIAAPLGQLADIVVAHQRIYHDHVHPSALVLPIIPASPAR